MSEEWVKFVTIAVTALVIIAVIAVVFIFVYFGSTTANQAADRLGSSTAALDQRTFDAYNQTTITGTAVLSAIKSYQGQPIGVIVMTKGSDGTRYNYCAQLADGGAVPDPLVSPYETAVAFEVDDSNRVTTEAYAYPDIQLLDITQATTKNFQGFINTNAKFKSALVYDANDEIIGVLVEQVGTENGLLDF